MLRLFAPYLPFVTEEVWSWWREGSIHRSAWPTTAEVLAPCGAAEDDRGVDSLQFAATVLGAIRKKKSEEQRPLKTPVTKAVVHAPAGLLVLLPEVESDLRASGLIEQLETAVTETLHVDVELAPPQLLREEGPA
jgi:valyl-tRNA synthetase